MVEKPEKEEWKGKMRHEKNWIKKQRYSIKIYMTSRKKGVELVKHVLAKNELMRTVLKI